MTDDTPRPPGHETLISVDVETAGPSPSGHSLLAIGACVVDAPERGFYVELRPDRVGAVPEAMAVSGLDLSELARTATPPPVAMERFEAWLLEVTPDGGIPVFVGFNAGFDWMFVADYFHRYLARNPFGHSALDIKSLAMGALGLSWRGTSMSRLAPALLQGRTLSHNALQDARDQAELFRAVRDRIGERTP